MLLKSWKQSMSVLLVIALFCSLFPIMTQAADEVPYVYVDKFPKSTDTGPILYRPYGITRDAMDNIYITDNDSGYVKKFDSIGNVLLVFGGIGSEEGKFLRSIGIAINKTTGYIYVLDRDKSYIQKFDAMGTYISKLGTSGAEDGQFNNPRGIAVDDNGYLYVADTGNQRIQKFDADDNYVTQWGRLGDGDSQFNNPFNIATSLEDGVITVFVTDRNNSRIQKFDSDGNFITKWGAMGANQGEFMLPESLTVDADGIVYVGDYLILERRIQKFTKDGVFISDSIWMDESVINGFVVDSLGNIIMTGSEGIQKLPFDRSYRVRWGSVPNKPAYIAISPSGKIYVTEWEGDRILQFDSDWTLRAVWTEIAPNDPFKMARGIAIDNDENVYFADAENHRIVVMSPDGELVRTWGTFGTGPFQFKYPFDIAFDSSGNVYITDYANIRIVKYNHDGTEFLGEWGSPGLETGQFHLPTSIAIDSNDYIYVTETSDNQRVQKFDSDGNFVTSWGSYGSDLGQFNAPIGIVISQEGNIFISDTGNNRIQVFRNDGTFLTAWGTEGVENGNFYNPFSLAFDLSNNLYVADRLNNRIQVFSSIKKIVDLTAVGRDRKADLTFTAPAYATTVIVEQTDDGGSTWANATTAGSLGAASTSTTVSGLTNGRQYHFRLNITGGPYEGISNVASATPASSGGDGSGGGVVIVLSNNANLISLTISEGALEPAFEPNLLTYQAEVDSFISSLQLNAAVEDIKAKLSINGQLHNSGSPLEIDLRSGSNIFNIVVTAENGNKNTYLLDIIRKQAVDSTHSTEFTDIDNHWARDLIHEAVELGIVQGNADHTFLPNNYITRAEFITMIVRAFGWPLDVSEISPIEKDAIPAGVKPYIYKSVQQEAVTGYPDGTYKPNQTITRAEAFAVVARALKLNEHKNEDTGFLDNNDIPQWVKGYIRALELEGIIQGRNDHRVWAKAKITRAEAVALVVKMAKHKKD